MYQLERIHWLSSGCSSHAAVILQLTEILSNTKLSEKFLTLARDLDVMEPKLPEDIYKMHLVDQRPGGLGNMDSAMKNLSSTLVNALINVGFGVDKLMTPVSEPGEKTVDWIFRNKDQGKMCAAASLGVRALFSHPFTLCLEFIFPVFLIN